jgi:hypothetical protein
MQREPTAKSADRLDPSACDQHEIRRQNPMHLYGPAPGPRRESQSSSSITRRTSTSRLPTWFAGPTTPSFSICSISLAARL